jgi:hypothetical protein
VNSAVHDLLGAWRLERWSLEYEDGRPSEFPLEPDARSMLLYTLAGPAGGWVSATLMNAGQPSASLAYAGRYDVRGGTVYHSIEIATDPTLVGITTTRHIAREGDVLTLSGPDFRAETGRSQTIVWRRLS